MTDKTQPEALRLADAIKASGQFTNLHTLDEASAELRRLHAENERLSCLCDKWNSECDEFREDNKRLAALVDAQQNARIAELEAQLEAVGAGGVSGPLVGRAAQPTAQAEGWTATAQHQTYRCKIKSRKQIDREIPRELQGWWADVAAGQKLLLRQAVQSDLDRCNIGGKRSRNPADYMCETHTGGSLVSKVALEYMNPEENVFAAPPTTSAGSGEGE